MLVAIERTKFTYLYKYNQVRVDINQLIDKSIEKLKAMLSGELSNLVLLFNKALPLFEQEHEIILLEIDKSKVIFQDGILISFDSIQCIYPLSRTGLQLLDGKINDDFIIESPIFENAIEALKLKRSMAFRRATAAKMLSHYNLAAMLNKSYFSLIESAIEKNLLDKTKPQVFSTYLDHLVAYNKTPSYIPDGNIEHICKIGAITIKYLDKPEEVFTNGPFYKSSIKYKSQINGSSYLTSYLAFNSIKDIELNSSIEKMIDIISKDYNGIDIFKVSYFFLAFKSFLNKHDNNIELLNNEIEALITNDKQSASFVIALLGYTFSIESIYEGLHKISNAPLLKSTQSKISAEIEKRKRKEAEIEKMKELEKAAIEQEKLKLSQLIQKEESKIEVVENVPVVADKLVVEAEIEKAGEEATGKVIHNPIETVSEPIVIYENTVKEDVLKSDNAKQQDFEEIKSSTESIKADSTEFEKEMPSVQIFKLFITKEQSKPKQKIWFDLLDSYFPSKHDEITLEKLLDKLDTIPEVKDKLLKTKKDREIIKSFFDSFK
jgi:hypothetical protein